MSRICLTPIIQYFERDTEPLYLAQLIDECISHYTDALSLNEHPFTRQDANKLHELRNLRNVLLQACGVHALNPHAQ